MAGRDWKSRAKGGGPRRERAKGVETAGDWLAMLALAQSCVEDAKGEAEGADADLRRANLANRINAASTGLFDRRAGAATSDAARAFVRVTRAFARRETPDLLRREMAPMVADGATFLDLQLHRLATADFERAHAGRPEVYG